jgi:hypothetical protein
LVQVEFSSRSKAGKAPSEEEVIMLAVMRAGVQVLREALGLEEEADGYMCLIIGIRQTGAESHGKRFSRLLVKS